MKRNQTYNLTDDLNDVHNQLAFLSASCVALSEQLGGDLMTMHPGDVMVALGTQLKQLAARVDHAFAELDRATRATAAAGGAR